MTPPFTYAHAGRTGLIDRVRYKLKECWFLALLLAHPWRRENTPVVLHNAVGSKAHVTRDFIDTRAASVAPEFAAGPVIEVLGGSLARKAVMLGPGLLLACLPRDWLIRIVAWLTRTREAPVLIFFDAHLSGFVLALALGRNGVATATLQHGLYRSDDRGSIMGLRNFVADRIFLWNELTRRAFQDEGYPTERLVISGEYGFPVPDTQTVRRDPRRVLIGPPYDPDLLPLFETVATTLSPEFETRFSLHPLFRKRFARLDPVPLPDLDPGPGVAICGDSGVLMDCLARRIPVITVAKRRLASAHLTLEEAPALTLADWHDLIAKARTCLDADRAAFGFDPVEPVSMASEAARS